MRSKKFAIVHAWDINVASAEREVALRFDIASRNIGALCYHVDQNGYIYDKKLNKTGNNIRKIEELSFALHLHFLTFKNFDIWSIYTLWNPPSILFDWSDPIFYLDSFVMHDDYVKSTGNVASDHLNILLEAKGRRFDGNQFLFPSLSESQVLPPQQLNPKSAKIFYCGVAWERSAGVPLRHNFVFKSLDSEDCIHFYGPSVCGGQPTPWEDFKNYHGEIPFDGNSLIEKINSYGICLALSSVVHQKSEIMSNRIYEAAAAGSLIITDKNDFVNKVFGDSVIQVENSGNSKKTFSEIMSAYRWAISHPSEAYAMASKAQKIFLEKLTLETHLSRIFDNLPERKRLIRNKIGAKVKTDVIDIFVIWSSSSLENIPLALKSIKKQLYPSLRIIIACDKALAQPISSLLKEYFSDKFEIKIVELNFFNWIDKTNFQVNRNLTTGAVFSDLLGYIESDFVAFLNPGEEWFCDHLDSLKRTLEDYPDTDVTYSYSLKKVLSYEYIQHVHRKEIVCDSLFSLVRHIAPENTTGNIMVRKHYLEKLQMKLFFNFIKFIDKVEFYPLMFEGIASNTVRVTMRTTHCLAYYLENSKGKVNIFEELLLPLDRQINYLLSYLLAYYSKDINFKHLREHINVAGEVHRIRVSAQDQSSFQDSSALVEAVQKNVLDILRSDNSLQAADNSSSNKRSMTNEEMMAVERCSLWSEDFYVSSYLGSSEWAISPIQHYCFVGAYQGLNPSPYFDSDYYLKSYPDVYESGINPLLHYIQYGYKEGRKIVPR